MRRFDIYKTIQLIVYIAAAALYLFINLLQPDFFKTVSSNPVFRGLNAAIWILLAVAFVFLFIDMNIEAYRIKKIKLLDFKASKDPIAKIDNRSSLDEVIRHYFDAPLPENVCTILFFLTSLPRVNDRLSREAGDRQIREFSIFLSRCLASFNGAKVGRNGGNSFLAIFENDKNDDISDYLNRIEGFVANHNKIHPEGWIRYKFGVASNHLEHADNIGQLISIAAKKAENAEIKPDEQGVFPVYQHYK